jgi:hypothetical protein
VADPLDLKRVQLPFKIRRIEDNVIISQGVILVKARHRGLLECSCPPFFSLPEGRKGMEWWSRIAEKYMDLFYTAEKAFEQR